jgi:topoisomerase IA-like protein
LGEGYKIIVSRTGPLFVLEGQGSEKAKFATVPSHLSVQTATLEDAKQAFEAEKTREKVTAVAVSMGVLDGEEVLKKKGRFGLYVTWKGQSLSCTEEDTLETLTPRLHTKVSADTIDHTVGPYRIKSGQYGLFMYKTGSRGKPVFVNLPADTAWKTLTVEGADALYKHCLANKPKSGGVRSTKTGTGTKTGTKQTQSHMIDSD